MLKRLVTLFAFTFLTMAAFAQQQHHQMTDDDFRALAASLSSHGPVVLQPALAIVPTATKSFTITAQATSESSGYSFSVSPSPFTVNQGDTVQLTFTVPASDKSDLKMHGLLMDTYFDGFTGGSQQPFDVNRGSSVTKTFVAGTAGTFGFVCNVTSCGPGHDSMIGTFKVNPQSNPAPTISSLNPTSGPAIGGTTVTISGTNFGSGATVTFGGTSGSSVNVVSSTSITVVTPAHAAGSVAVTVANSDSQSATLNNGYQYVSGPSLSAISPASGSPAGGQTVTLTGTNFASGDTVKFGTTAATNVVVASSTSMTAVTPAHAAGKVDVVVTTGDGSTSATLPQAYEFGLFPPTLTSVNPQTGPNSGNTLVTLTGTNFQPGAVVTFGSVPATSVTVVNSTTITVRTPVGPDSEQVGQSVSVQVTNPDSGSVSASLFFYSVPALTVTCGIL